MELVRRICLIFRHLILGDHFLYSYHLIVEQVVIMSELKGLSVTILMYFDGQLLFNIGGY